VICIGLFYRLEKLLVVTVTRTFAMHAVIILCIDSGIRLWRGLNYSSRILVSKILVLISHRNSYPMLSLYYRLC
jgi:hypothetical protein